MNRTKIDKKLTKPNPICIQITGFSDNKTLTFGLLVTLFPTEKKAALFFINPLVSFDEERLETLGPSAEAVLTKELEKITNHTIDYKLSISENNFKRIIDILGGVPVYFDPGLIRKTSENYQRRVGEYMLSGEDISDFLKLRDPENPTGYLERLWSQETVTLVLSKRFYKSKSLNHKLLSIIRENELLYDTLNHDIKNSLTGIAGLKDILNRLLVRKNINEPDLNRYLMALFSANNRALSIVNEFTSLSEVNYELNENKLEEFNLEENITNLLDNFQGKISSKNIQLSMNCPKQIRLKTNRVSLNRILENLISNAIKFTPSGKKIHIEVEVYIDKPLSICITDEGIGIPDKILKHIFELSSIKKRQGLENEISTGLGLFICKTISQKLRGDINVESREDHGSKFTLSLPLDIVVNE